MLAAMVLAAGRGNRMRPLTDTTPKPLLMAGGKSLIERHVEKLAAAGFGRIVVNHAWLGSQIENTVGSGERWGVAIHYSRERHARETAGGIATALPLIAAEAFAVVNADVYSEYDYARLHETVRRLLDDARFLAHLVLVDNPPHHTAGDFGLEDGAVSLAPARKLTFSGLAAYRRAFFSTVSPGEKKALAPLLQSHATEGKISGEYFRGRWSDVGTPERLADLDRELAKKQA